MKKKILIIAYYFPPLGEGGVQRIVKFLKYLNQDKYQFYVLAPDVETKFVKDSSLADEIPRQVKIIRTPLISLEQSVEFLMKYKLSFLIPFMYPDQFIGWLPFAVKKALKIIDEEKIETVFTTSSPITTFFIGLILKKKRQIRWIADFRDPWSLNPLTYVYLGKIRKFLDKIIEKRTLPICDYVIANTPTNKKNLCKYLGADPQKVKVITNGFDNDDFVVDTKLKTQLDPSFFNIVYTGTFYFNYNAEVFLNAINDYLLKNPKIRIYFIGLSAQWAREYLQRPTVDQSLRDQIICVDYVPHNLSITFLLAATILLLVLPAGMSHWIPGKLYEYIRSGVPIFALIPEEGDAAQIIRETNTGYIIDVHLAEVIETRLDELYENWLAGKLVISPDIENIMNYDRRILSDKLAKYL
jgi:glycosyltransferase involved in cell wall biosynthesis